MKKTYKREVAASALVYTAALGVLAAATGSESAFRVYEVTIAPAMLLGSRPIDFRHLA
jgi:hypothetical protein